VRGELLVDECAALACAVGGVKDGDGAAVAQKVQHIVERLKCKVTVGGMRKERAGD